MRAYIAGLLDADYDVTCAADGADALEAALAAPPDLVLTDVMMPVLDGFGLLDALAGHPATMAVPVVMLSARADDEATVDALEAGADDYLVKPFSARELLARVRANLELDRARRTQARLERSQTLLDQAERLAEIGSWEVDLAADTVTGSAEYFRIMGIDPDGDGPPSATATYAIVHPDDRRRVMEAVATLKASGAPLDHEFRIVPAGSAERVVRTRVVLERGAGGDCLRGSLQDVTDQHHAEEALRAAAAAQEAAAREHHIAEELQASLLPAPGFNPEHLSVASYYRAGVEGTQVGGDWYDVIELGAGRTALVLGDVMGRGVHAAAVMGQLRAAVRAYARLDLSPVDILEHLDGIVRDLGEDSIVTCVYAVYDPADGSLVYANAGHLPPLLVSPSAPLRRLRTAGPPLGTGPFPLTDEQVTLEPGALFLLYTDGLVERRDRDVGAGIDELSDTVAGLAVPVEDIPAALVAALVPEGVDDDIAVLVARRPDQRPAPTVTRQIPSVPRAVGEARHFVVAALADWSVDGRIAQDIVLASDELVTNAIVHGRSPVDVRLRRTPAHLFVEVHDGTRVLPQQRRPTESSEHGRGLQIVGRLADVWGTRPTPQGKAVWCRFALPAAAATD
jgi:serine phosphatase RsbU (regulator of sigma subunit)/CheY-like chemotaxis protein/anti-sigma regulatory factor (Ser/Thr protein kinase)